jgi:hypothetical protein
MGKRAARGWLTAGIVAGICAAFLALVFAQRQAIARLVITSVVASVAHVRLGFDRLSVGVDRTDFGGMRVASLRGEPIGYLQGGSLTYDLHDLLGGKRLFGLTSLSLERPRIEIVRHRDGTFNVPNYKLPSNGGTAGPPLRATVAIAGGSIDVIDKGDVDPRQRHLFVRNVAFHGNLATDARSTYNVGFDYGEQPQRLYPVRGYGDIDARSGFSLLRVTAATLPVAGAVDFVLNSPSMHLASGELRDLDARLFSYPVDGSRTHLAASAQLEGARIALGGLSKPVDGVRGIVDVDENGLLARRLDASIAGVAVRIHGGIAGAEHPQIRLAVDGAGDLSHLRSAFKQSAALPMSGPIAFNILVEGNPTKPLEWIALRSPHARYARAEVERTGGLVAFDGQEADVVSFSTRWQNVDANARGRVALQRGRNSVVMLLGAHASLPGANVDALGLANADDPKSIAMRGLVTGNSPAAALDATFDVASNGAGSAGPLLLRDRRGGGDLYARAALDRPHDRSSAFFDARSFALADFGRITGRGAVSLSRGLLDGETIARLADGTGTTAVDATLAGTPASPQLTASVTADHMHYRQLDVSGNATLALTRQTLVIRNALAQLGPAFVGIDGTVAGVMPGSVRRLDLTARLQSSDVHELARIVQPKYAGAIEGSVDATVAVGGTPSSPAIAGSFDAPEGSVNGLAFRDLHASLSGVPGTVVLQGGRVTVGSTAVAFAATANAAASNLSLSAPRADLADFNDFFETGDTLAGTGSVALDASLARTKLVASNGTVRLRDARYRRIDFGNVAANWRGTGQSIAGEVALNGPNGDVRARGTFVAPFDKLRVTNANATVRNLNLAAWLPMLGIAAPVTGRLNADAAKAGTTGLAMDLRAEVFGGTIGRFPIQKLQVVATADYGRETIHSAILELPSLSATGSGSFGLNENDPIALEARVESADLGALASQAVGKPYDFGGVLDSTVRVQGTRAKPRVDSNVAIRSLRYAGVEIPMVKGELTAGYHEFSLRRGEADLAFGRVLLDGTYAHDAISGSLVAENVEASNFATALPKGVRAGGRIDGSVRASGTLRSPRLNGTLALRDGTFSGPMEKAPITAARASLVFDGTRVLLQDARADVGGGSIALDGNASIPDLRSVGDLTFALQARASNARLEMPAYFQGNLNAAVAVSKRPNEPTTVGGDVAVSSARIPTTAFYNPSAAKQSPPPLPPVAFDGLKISAGRDVRVQSNNVDVGGEGSATLEGTIAAPTLAGTFNATGGTISFYHTFRVERGSISFDRYAGVVPYVNAVASTYIADPATAIRLHATGPATNMNLALASDPEYSREQILGLLVGANQLGAVRGVSAGSASGGFSMPGAAANLAKAQVNQVFTRQLLEPLSAALGSSLGFTDLQISNDLQTGLGLNAVKKLGKNVSVAASETFGTPRVQSVALEVSHSIATALRMRLYSTQGASIAGISTQQQTSVVGAPSLNPMTQIANPSGTNGLDFSYVRKFSP